MRDPAGRAAFGIHRRRVWPLSRGADKRPTPAAQARTQVNPTMKIEKDRVVQFHYTVNERNAHEAGEEAFQEVLIEATGLR